MNKNLVYISSVGGSLEFFDFMIFVHLYPVIIENFFPTSDNNLQKTFLTILTFVISYIAKPFGGIFYGIVGERFGVVKSFNSTLLIISISTLCITFLPTYKEIGIFSTIFLILFRILQGFSNGGEIPSSVIYIYENAKEKEKEKSLSCLFFAFTIGSCISSYLAILSTSFKAELGENIYFRLPFLIGGIFSVIAYLIRKRFTKSNPKKTNNHDNFIYTIINIKSHFRFILIYGFGSTLMANYFILTPNIYLNKYYNNNNSIKFIISISLLFIAIFTLINAYFVNKYNFKKLYLTGVLLNIIFSPFYFFLITSKNEYYFITGQIFASIICAPIFGNIYSIICNSFKNNLILKFSIVSNFAVTIFPPLTSSIIIYLISLNITLLPSILVSFYGVIILIMILKQKYLTEINERTQNDILNRSV